MKDSTLNKVTGSVDFTYRVRIECLAKSGYEREQLHLKAMAERHKQTEIGKRISSIKIEPNGKLKQEEVKTFLTPYEYYLDGIRTYMKAINKVFDIYR